MNSTSLPLQGRFMRMIHWTTRRGRGRHRLALLGVLSLLAFCAQLALAAPAGAVPYSGGLSPTIFDGMADLNGEIVDAGLGDPTDGADILGNTQTNTNPCGFGNPPDAANNGLVDLNSDGEI